MHFFEDVSLLDTDVAESKSISSAKRTHVEKLVFDARQAQHIDKVSLEIARFGGPQARGAKLMAAGCAKEVALTFTQNQKSVAQKYADGKLALLVFEGLLALEDDVLPASLPVLEELETDPVCLYLASRNQILLHLVGQESFAYDIDNQGRIMRVVGNFKGGGETKIEGEDNSKAVELSSHSGLALGAHTEAPYHCSVKAVDGHSPAPSSLILTARWNPLDEPTTVIPMYDIIERLGAYKALALTSKSFKFSRSDSFVLGKGEGAEAVSILDFDERGAFSLRYNSYRISVCEGASEAATAAFESLKTEVSKGEMVRVALQQNNAIVINNTTALHCRDVIKDNRRLLVRLFGYSEDAEPVVLSKEPLVVQG